MGKSNTYNNFWKRDFLTLGLAKPGLKIKVINIFVTAQREEQAMISTCKYFKS